MIQSLLLFILGFLAAGLIAILLLPPLQRRAERLTRQRLEATLPMSLNEIQAEKDRSRAEYAAITRKLEAQLAGQREKANLGLIEIAQRAERERSLAADLVDRDTQITRSEKIITERDATIETQGQTLVRLEAQLNEATNRFDQAQDALAENGRLLEEASLKATRRQIEIAERDTEIERLTTQFAQLRSRREASDKEANERSAEAKASKEALKVERQKVGDLETKLQRLLRDVTDKAEQLERRDRTIERLKEQNKAKKPVRATAKAKAAETDPGKDDTSLLRDELAGIAAEVVNLTRMVEGPNSPIDRVLEGQGPASGTRPTLAQRIMDLRDKSASAKPS